MQQHPSSHVAWMPLTTAFSTVPTCGAAASCAHEGSWTEVDRVGAPGMVAQLCLHCTDAAQQLQAWHTGGSMPHRGRLVLCNCQQQPGQKATRPARAI